MSQIPYVAIDALNGSYLLRQLPFYLENVEKKPHVIELTDTARDLGVIISSS